MGEKRNALIDMSRVAAALGVILCHVDMRAYGTAGVFLGQFLAPRISLMFFLMLIGFYLEKGRQQGKNNVFKRALALTKIYTVWSFLYMALSFVMLVLREGMPLDAYLISRLKAYFFSGSYYHFWFYPAVIYALLLIGGVQKWLGERSNRLLLPLGCVLYAIGLLGTGYAPVGRQIPLLRELYASDNFEAVMHVCLLGFPSVVFGMAAARRSIVRPSILLPACLYAAECAVLCFGLKWQENPQMLLTAPVLAAAFLHWAEKNRVTLRRVDPLLLRNVSALMYNVHPLLLAALALVLPTLGGAGAFVLCTAGSACFAWIVYSLRKYRVVAWLM